MVVHCLHLHNTGSALFTKPFFHILMFEPLKPIGIGLLPHDYLIHLIFALRSRSVYVYIFLLISIPIYLSVYISIYSILHLSEFRTQSASRLI